MSHRPTRMLIEDRLERIARIERFVAGVEREAFLRDEKTADSVVRNLEVIGEAAMGSPNTPFLKLLNGSRGDDDGDEEHAKGGRSTRTLVIRNADTSFVFFALQDGVIAPVPAEDSFGQPTDFSRSAEIKGAEQLDLVGQGTHDPILGTTHLGILNSPQTRQAVLEFLTKRTKHH